MVLTQTQTADVTNIVNKITQDLFGEAFVNKLIKSISALVLAEINEKFVNFEKEINNLKSENRQLRQNIDNLEQYTRRNSIRVFGVPERDGENVEDTVLKIFQEKLELQIDKRNIDRCHRVGQRKNNINRAIIVKFTSYKYRSQVYTNKKKLKGLKIVIREDLTKMRQMLLVEMKEAFDSKNIWTFDGTIYVAINNKKFVVRTLDDVNKIKSTTLSKSLNAKDE
jgi:hypothetical protein